MTDRGPLQEYEVTWVSGRVDYLVAHQVTYPGGFNFVTGGHGPEHICFHAEIDGQWLLILDALYSEIASVRCLSQIPGAK